MSTDATDLTNVFEMEGMDGVLEVIESMPDDAKIEIDGEISTVKELKEQGAQLARGR